MGHNESMTSWDPADHRGYGTLPIPVPQDYDLAEDLRGHFFAQTLGTFVAGLPAGADDVLSAFCERRCAIAVRDGNPDDAALALASGAAAMATTRDARDVMGSLALVWKSYELIGCDPLAEISGHLRSTRFDWVPESVALFFVRPPEDRSIAVMGYREEGAGSTFRYRRTW